MLNPDENCLKLQMDQQQIQFYLASGSKKTSVIMLLRNMFSCKGLYIDAGFMFFYQFAGYNVVTNYAGVILQKDEELLFNSTENSAENRCVF